MPDPISNLIANLLNSEWFYLVIGIWLLAAIANKPERNSLKDKLIDLLTKPIVFDEDDNPNSVPFYPRVNFERVSRAASKALVSIPRELNRKLKEWVRAQFHFVADEGKPWKVFGYLLHLAFMFFFVWADGIAIANALDALGLLRSVWEPLTLYELAVAFGSFFAILVASLVAREISGKKSDLSDWDEKDEKDPWRNIAKYLTFILIVSGLIVVIALGLGRYERLGFISSEWSRPISNFVNVTTLILVPLNTVIATILIHHESFKGVFLIFILIEGIFSTLVQIIEYITGVLGAMGPFTVDVIYRFMLGVVFVILFFLFTPLDFITGLFPTRKKTV